jgi:hypothetical protein
MALEQALDLGREDVHEIAGCRQSHGRKPTYK